MRHHHVTGPRRQPAVHSICPGILYDEGTAVWHVCPCAFREQFGVTEAEMSDEEIVNGLQEVLQAKLRYPVPIYREDQCGSN